MSRLAITIGLCLSLLFMIKGIVNTFQANPLSEEESAATPKKLRKVPARPITLYPEVPARLPDFGKDYLFNEERSLEGDGKTGRSNEDVVVNIDEVIYEGSLIIGDVRKAIIGYSTKSHIVGRNPRTRKGRPAGGSESVHVRVSEGEIVGGYKVIEVSPVKIVFEKNGERIEKVLFDATKERQITARPRSNPRQAPVVSRPGGVVGRFDRSINSGRGKMVRQKKTFRRPPPAPPTIQNAPAGGAMANPFETGR